MERCSPTNSRKYQFITCLMRIVAAVNSNSVIQISPFRENSTTLLEMEPQVGGTALRYGRRTQLPTKTKLIRCRTLDSTNDVKRRRRRCDPLDGFARNEIFVMPAATSVERGVQLRLLLVARIQQLIAIKGICEIQLFKSTHCDSRNIGQWRHRDEG